MVSRSGYMNLAKTAFIGTPAFASRALAMFAAVLLFVAAGTRAIGDERVGPEDGSLDAIAPAGSEDAGDGDTGGPQRLKVGMSLEEALALVGKDPDSQEEIGAACGMLDVHNWDEDGTRIISVDGTVTSIVEGKKPRP